MMDQFVEQQEKETRAQMDALLADYQDMLQKLQLAHNRELNDLKAEWETSDCRAQQQYSILMKRYEQLQTDNAALVQQHQALETQREYLEQELETKRTASFTYQNNPINDSGDDDATNSQPTVPDHLQQHQLPYDDQVVLMKMGQQHRNELEVLYNQYQQALRAKDLELEAYADRLKAISMTRQKELETCKMEADNRTDHLTRQLEEYKMSIQGYVNTLEELQTQIGTLERQNRHDQEAILRLTQEKQALVEEKERLSRMIPHVALG